MTPTFFLARRKISVIALIASLLAVAASVHLTVNAAGQEPASYVDPHLVLGSPDAPEVEDLPIEILPALYQRLEPLAVRLRSDPLSIAVFGHKCPDGWTPRMTANGKSRLYVPFGMLVDKGGEPRTPYTPLLACEKAAE